ncbi:MAG: DUF6345 domain-containing protein [Thermoproteota archaeon]
MYLSKRTERRIVLLMLVIFLLSIPNYSAFAGNDDSNIKEIGVYYIEDYDYSRVPSSIGTFDNLPNARTGPVAFYNALGTIGWTKLFCLGNDNVREKYFEKPSVGGADFSTYGVDSADFAWFCGHGSPDAFWFGTNYGGDGNYPCRVHYSEAEWENEDLEWIVIDACQVLRYGSGFLPKWTSIFKGLRVIFGLHSIIPNRDDSDLMRVFVNCLKGGVPTYEAWHWATKSCLPPTCLGKGVYTAIMASIYPKSGASVGYQWEDYLPGHGSVSSDFDPVYGIGGAGQIES